MFLFRYRCIYTLYVSGQFRKLREQIAHAMVHSEFSKTPNGLTRANDNDDKSLNSKRNVHVTRTECPAEISGANF